VAIIGQRLGGDPAIEDEHFMPCGSCGQEFDMRDFEQLAHHETSGHGPYPLPRRLCAASLLLTETLADRPTHRAPSGQASGAEPSPRPDERTTHEHFETRVREHGPGETARDRREGRGQRAAGQAQLCEGPEPRGERRQAWRGSGPRPVSEAGGGLTHQRSDQWFISPWVLVAAAVFALGTEAALKVQQAANWGLQ
jgi:hypothetical protein